ncbi:hypothetical protein C7H62_0782 [Mesoflavibacter sp. HG96]|uniref:DUF58 domain-containing protein n=1 Tax=Mesoflavibacter TaxID=444051 RepID=UPI000D0EF6E0|nr:MULTISPECIES: DUF58 domain-containing protein [Mesoflavibacter]QIJ88591.1 hypothetical protein C7H62_0782 [Mesoflavibacter sp. HG96]QIJ91319.1 hypothetical protein C7H56_0782 [Mesoflavibacter sp. HG37]
MEIKKELNKTGGFKNLEHLAKQVVEGFISGMHKSPFHGFSAEFAEHKIYNLGDSTKHIDWKLFAKTDKLYTKKYDDETNLRCHIIIDNSSSMHYPLIENLSIKRLNKIAFSALASASLMQILKKQRDAVGLSVYSDVLEFYSPEKGSERHHQMLLNTLDELVNKKPVNSNTNTYKFLHQIAEKIHRRSLIFVFTDMLQSDIEEENLFEALSHLKYNKHEVVLFHVLDLKKELNFNFENSPKKYLDLETNDFVNLYADQAKQNYISGFSKYINKLKNKCLNYKVNYVEADINGDFNTILSTYLLERQKLI